MANQLLGLDLLILDELGYLTRPAGLSCATCCRSC